MNDIGRVTICKLWDRHADEFNLVFLKDLDIFLNGLVCSPQNDTCEHKRQSKAHAPTPSSSLANRNHFIWVLKLHGNGVRRNDERLLAALGLVLLGLLLGQSRVERHLHHGAAWGALGGRWRRARGTGCGLLAAAAASSAGLRARLSGGGGGPAAARWPRRRLRHQSYSLAARGRGRRRLAPRRGRADRCGRGQGRGRRPYGRGPEV
ncbi:TPA: hypothetical protein BOS_12472 [Bos taurus]|nr:TPA: hypothetical protein BOS_12472 [Bos taurus]